MKRLLLVFALLALGCAPASAQQDVRDSGWSGFYAGAQLGYGFGNTSSVTTNLVGTFPVPFDYSSDGMLGGVHAGYNLQIGAFVFGLEGDVGASAVSDSQSVDLYGVTYGSKTMLDFDGSLRARAGFAYNRLLLYGTAGVAWGRVKIDYSCGGCVAAAGATSTLDDLRVGWTVGAGVDYALSTDVSLNLEYRYTDLGSERLIDQVQVADYHDNRFTYSALRLGLSYYFSP